ncbi:WAT1-related protein At4g30420-like [Silene latifolia]|uniref:WAT1-related protein At4g30420-like n=1 Tax=Silene latifolia TaxID=37657 RepID=UPI003D7846FF
MGAWEDHSPAAAMISLQFVSAINALLNRASLMTGMSPLVFTVYRQAIAAIFTFSLCYFTRGQSSRSEANMGIKSFLLISISAFIGVVLYQVFYYQGLYLTSSSIGTASSNLTPAITFIFAIILGMEQVSITKLSNIAKIFGTIICVGGALCIALIRGPKILNDQVPISMTKFLVLESTSSDHNWILGCLFLFLSKSCWAAWLIMQVSVSACYPDSLSLSAWTCFLGMLQAATIAVFTNPDLKSWNLSSPLELTSCFFSGVVGSGARYFIQAWCIKKRGPFYSSIFGPLSTVVTTVLACIFLHEDLYIGSLLGAIAVIIGLYIVLWGKSEERNEISHSKLDENQVQEHMDLESDVEHPLLIENPNKIDPVA